MFCVIIISNKQLGEYMDYLFEDIKVVKYDKEHFLNNVGKINMEIKNQFINGNLFLFVVKAEIDNDDSAIYLYSKQNTNTKEIVNTTLKILSKNNGTLLDNTIMEYDLSNFDLQNHKFKTTKDIMTKEHPRWNEFCEMLIAKDGCNFTLEDDGEYSWTCDNTFKFTKIILEYMEDFNINESIEYFKENGAYCDCEILMNLCFNDFISETLN
jgi:hypothetical protein